MDDIHSTQKKFQWRDGDASRLETFSDAVFGFSIALLIVSMDVPKSYDALVDTLWGFFGFLLSFAMLVLIWFYHYRLFTQFKINDLYMIFLNAVLLFVVLFYVYPLKYLTNLLADLMTGHFPLTPEESKNLVIIYSVGFIAVFSVLALMHRHVVAVLQKQSATALEVLKAKSHIWDCSVMISVGVLSVILAFVMPVMLSAFVGGIIYFMISPLQIMVDKKYQKEKLRLETGEDKEQQETIQESEPVVKTGKK